MARRYCGELRIYVTYVNGDDYTGSVVAPDGKRYSLNGLRAAPIGFGSGVAYDSPKAYDKMAASAVAFATYDNEDWSGFADYDETGEPNVTRKRA
jgi:hypothetical protein